MSDVIFVGELNGEMFVDHAPVEVVEQLLHLINEGEDAVFDSTVTRLSEMSAKCVNAMSWEQQTFITKMIEMMKTGSRFGISHRELKFGVGPSAPEASRAFLNKEF